ncbi:Transcriptional regulator [Streptococcus gallolyticus]|uniref:Transcriptional regulator n=1 Tax=Streptococcus gallolyticus TaxID=315405 RepID=A0A139R407_9STRE|nr:Transcriptional regulator [Streptococcus gallolyticus]KXU09374.1 Transcriptional regulator [Streptococcus gallolyticus]
MILIDLYFACLASAKSFVGIYSLDLYDELMECLLNQENLSPEISLILNNVLLNNVDLVLRFHRESLMKRIIIKSDTIMTSVHDFQRRPVLSLVEWKYYLQFKKDFLAAQKSYSNAILFANLIGDTYLENKLKEEWELDTTT